MMELFHPELVHGPLALIVEHLAPADRARLALTCRAGRRAALTAPVEQELSLRHEQLASFNAWLSRRTTAAPGAGAVRAVQLTQDPQGRAVAAACHLARCGISSLRLSHPSAALLEAACTIGSLTSLEVYSPRCSLDPLGALRQLQMLSLEAFSRPEQGDAPPAWRLPLPAITELVLDSTTDPCSVGLDGCSALQRLRVLESNGLAVTASRALPQLTRLELWSPMNAALPWQHLAGLRELVLQRNNDASLLQGAAHLTSLTSLHVDCGNNFMLPPGAWLAGVTRLVLEDFNHGEDPEDLGWATSVTGVEELVLWLWLYSAANHPTAQDILKSLKWVRWAGGLPRLRSLELRVGAEFLIEDTGMLCKAVRVEGEGVKSMLQQLTWDLAGML